MVFKSRLADAHPPAHYQDSLAHYFWAQLDRFAGRTLFVDRASGRHWTGAQIKSTAGRLARRLVRLAGLEANHDCVLLYQNSDHSHLTALALLFAGASVCTVAPDMPEPEQAYRVGLVRPALVFATWRLHERLCRLRQDLGLAFCLVIMDDHLEEGARCLAGGQAGAPPTLGLHAHLLADDAGAPLEPLELPVRVHPDRPAFVLFTSGSTGRPKSVGRSQRNSLHVCFCLDGAEHLWRLEPGSVLAGHLPLDHSTGLFSLKVTLAKGLKLVLMPGYQFEHMLDAIEQYRITDVILASALLHNFMSSGEQLRGRDLSSLRNMLSVGSPIASPARAREFMAAHPGCSVRQAFGMTECSFISVAAPGDLDSVGQLLANVRVKLVDSGTRAEIHEPGREGELLVGGPAVAAGYLGEQFREQSRAAFLADGYYVSTDICALTSDHRLQVRGRSAEVLCLNDGWKVLPYEIEQVLLEHPLIEQAAVVGVPHPELPTCHAPRAYVVCRPGAGAPLTERQVREFAAARLAEPKHLVGGVRFMDTLPRISIGKVDKRLLKQMDGL